MRLETSQDLLERLREKYGTSWYGLGRLIGVHENTITNWKGGRTIVDRRFAPRIAHLLDEPTEYDVACLEAQRETEPDMKKVWERIAQKFRSHAASVLLVSALMFGVGSAGKTEAAEHSPADAGSPPMYVMTNRRRRRPWWDFATWIPLPA